MEDIKRNKIVIIHKCCSKGFKLHPESKDIAEYCCGNTLPFLVKLEKLIQIFVLISVYVRLIQKRGVQQI